MSDRRPPPGPRPLVPTLNLSDAARRALRAGVALGQWELLPMPTWRLVSHVAAEADVCVANLTRVSQGGPLLDAYRLVAQHPSCTLVALTDAFRDGAAGDWLPDAVVSVSVRVSGEDLVRCVAKARFRGWAERMRRLALSSDSLPYVARVGVYHALTARDGLVPGGLTSRRPDSIERVAQRAGVSRTHLSRTLRGCGINMRQVLDAWTLVQGVAYRSYLTLPWERVGPRFGYASLSGLSDAFHRSAGVRLRQAEGGPPERWCVWFERDVVRPILGFDRAG